MSKNINKENSEERVLKNTALLIKIEIGLF